MSAAHTPSQSVSDLAAYACKVALLEGDRELTVAELCARFLAVCGLCMCVAAYLGAT